MKLFRFPKRNRRYANEESALQRFFRFILLVLLFGGVALGFWLNNQRRMEMMQNKKQTERSGFPEIENRLPARALCKNVLPEPDASRLPAVNKTTMV